MTYNVHRCVGVDRRLLLLEILLDDPRAAHLQPANAMLRMGHNVAFITGAAGGGLLVAVSGVARVTALRIKAHRETKERDARPAPPAVVNGTADGGETAPRRLPRRVHRTHPPRLTPAPCACRTGV